MNGEDLVKAIAIVASAREQGNCYDLANFTLERLGSAGVQTELVNFYDYRITPCQRCSYECLRRPGQENGFSARCPIDDDVRSLWEKTWGAEILLLFVPNYGGLPPALWIGFSQRAQAFFREAPAEKLKSSAVSAVVLASPATSSGAQWTPSVMADEVKWLGRKVAAFEVIDNAGYETGNSCGGLIGEPEIRSRLEHLANRTLRVARVASSQHRP